MSSLISARSSSRPSSPSRGSYAIQPAATPIAPRAVVIQTNIASDSSDKEKADKHKQNAEPEYFADLFTYMPLTSHSMDGDDVANNNARGFNNNINVPRMTRAYADGSD